MALRRKNTGFLPPCQVTTEIFRGISRKNEFSASENEFFREITSCNKQFLTALGTTGPDASVGAAALFLMLFAKFQILNATQGFLIPVALVSAHALSRLSAIWIMRSLSYVKFSGKSKPLAVEIKGADFVLAHLFGLAPLFLGIVALMVLYAYTPKLIAELLLCILIPVLLSWLWWRNKIKNWLGGYTGDTLGAMQQITELCFYLGVLAWNWRL
jgi:adenosylcobinamide-GDP ribazoletransferase